MIPRMRRFLAALLLVLVAPSLLYSDEVNDRRAAAGIRLFRALLAADLDLPKKTVAPNQLLVVFFYVDDKAPRRRSGAALRHRGQDPRAVGRHRGHERPEFRRVREPRSGGHLHRRSRPRSSR